MKFNIVKSSAELVSNVDIVFVCVRPVDMKSVLESIKYSIDDETLLVSLNGSITFDMLESVVPAKIAKVIPSVTAEINKSQSLVCYNSRVSDTDKQNLETLLASLGSVIELPENEIGMGSELVSCMPGFIASIFDSVVTSAKQHTEIPREQMISMVLNTLMATGELMLTKDMSFSDVVSRVATKGGITEEGTKVVYDKFPKVCDELFERALAKRNVTAEKPERFFSESI